MIPTTKYAKSGDVHVAYQLFGDGSVELVVVPGFISHIENYWEDPSLARWLSRLASFARVAIFDKRGTGLSGRVGDAPGMDVRMDDVRAVMDAAGFERASLIGISEGGSLAALFAAHHPERCGGLVLVGSFAQFASWFPTQEALGDLLDYMESDWGTGKSLPLFAPSMAGDPAFEQWWGRFERLGANPGEAMAIMRLNSQIDIGAALATIRVPTLVVHRTDDVTIDVEGGRALAEAIPGARLFELPGCDHCPWVGDNADEIVDAIEEFLTGTRTAPMIDRVLATVVFTDIVASTERAGTLGDEAWHDLLCAHDRTIRRELARYRGTEVKSLGDGFLATFDGPARAIHCARSICSAVRPLGIDVRVGAHTGEVKVVDDDIHGIAVNLASRIADLADPGDIIVSRTVRDLVVGSGIEFEDFGTHELRGVPDTWQLLRVAA